MSSVAGLALAVGLALLAHPIALLVEKPWLASILQVLALTLVIDSLANTPQAILRRKRLHNPDINAEEAEPYSKDDTGFREYKVKLCKIRDRILTDEGRRLASERHDFMERFFKRFINEYEGKR